MIKETNLAPDRSEFLQTTLAADGHLAEGTGTRRLTFSKTEGQNFEAR
jgi:hypothetical protein